MSFRSIWCYVRQFFSSRKDRLDADVVDAYYERLLQDSDEGAEDLRTGPRFRKQDVYERIREAMNRIPPVNRSQRFAIPLAACIAAVACVSVGYWYMAREVAPLAGTMKTAHNTVIGAVRQITLPDGSCVWLNSGSTISYFADNRAEIRAVKLQGEAYFDVVEDNKRPLVGHTELLKIQVLGTMFNVRAHLDENNVAVSVTAGIVRVGADSKSGHEEITLHPDQQVKYDKISNRLMQKESVKAGDKAAWVAGNMRYQETPLRIILADLERRFHIKTDADSALTECMITVDFGTDGPAKALEILAGVLAGNVQFKQGVYKLTGQPCE